LSRAIIRRCQLLLALPEKYHEVLLSELKKPKNTQKLTEDFFIEMERALKTVERRMPDLIEQKDKTRQVLISKFKKGVIPNRVHFRMLAKIARADNVEASPEKARDALRRVFERNDVSIEEAYASSVQEEYLERDLVARVRAVMQLLSAVEEDELDDEVFDTLNELYGAIGSLIGARQ